MSSVENNNTPSLEGDKKQVRYPTFNYRDYGQYQPRDTILVTARAAAISTGAGIFVSALKASLGPARTSLGSIITHSRYIWLYGAVGTAYTFGESITANLRGKESAWNTFAGGALAGGIMGSTFRSLPKVFGGGIAVGTALGLAHFTGGFNSYGEQAQENSRGEPVEIEKGQKQGFWEVVHRRPLSQTLEELGDLAKPFNR